MTKTRKQHDEAPRLTAECAASPTRTLSIPIADIVVEGLQTRAGLQSDVVEEYASAMLDDAPDGRGFPPVVLFQDGIVRYLADGHHRLAAAEKADVTELEATVYRGSQRDALRFALSANTAHGLRRSNADKRRAVEIALADSRWGKLSSREIAQLCGVTHTLVNDLRAEAAGKSRPPKKPKKPTVEAPAVRDEPRLDDVEVAPSQPGWVRNINGLLARQVTALHALADLQRELATALADARDLGVVHRHARLVTGPAADSVVVHASEAAAQIKAAFLEEECGACRLGGGQGAPCADCGGLGWGAA